MNHHFLIRPFSLLVLITLVLLFRKALCREDYRYTNCNPTTCGHGGPNISFPFYIQHEQEPFCGYPGFNLYCQDWQPILKLGDNNYIIHQIFYENQSFHVSDQQLLNTSSTTCLPRFQNMSLPIERFKLSHKQREIILLYNCSSKLADANYNLSQHKVVDCSKANETDNSITLAIFGDDPLWKNVSESCGNRVVAPVLQEEGGGVDRGGWEDVGGMLNGALSGGFLLDWIASNCNDCQRSGGKCGFNESTYHFWCFCPDRPHSLSCFPDSKSRTFVAVIVSSVAGIGVLLIAVYCFRKNPIFCWNGRSRDHKIVEAFLRNHRSLAPKRYMYSEVNRITKGFKEKLGQGGYGSVFKGKLPDGRLVAVKVLKGSKSNGEDFINEVASISRTSHVNIVPLFGFCFEGSKRALIYEFMPNGSLEKHIYEEKTLKSDRQLGWETLQQIAIGIAQGLEYLHRGCNTRILHLDIKPHNILLDDNFCPKISDFGLAKICTKKDSIVSLIGARGTIGYIAPEVFCRNIGGVSHKSDVYSYGMLVLEMVGARKNICIEVDHSSEIYFPHWIFDRLELGDDLGLSGINNDENKQIARKMIIVSLWCIQTDPPNRPPMCRVVEMLQNSLESLTIPPRPYLSSPSRSPPRTLSNTSTSYIQ